MDIDLVIENRKDCEDFMLSDFEVTIEDILQAESEHDREEGIYERVITKQYAR